MRLIMFDMDGTLIDSQAMIAEQTAAAFAAVGLALPDQTASRSVIGLALPIALGRLAGTDDPELIERLVIAYKASYSANLAVASGREPLYPGTREALDILHARPEAILGVATGKGLSGVNRLLDLHGLTGHFATLQTPDHNPSKPHPGMLLRAMAQTGALASETVMIGDTTFDMETAVAAGVAGIGVSWGYHPHEHLTEAGAVRIVHDYADLPAAIDEVLGA